MLCIFSYFFIYFIITSKPKTRERFDMGSDRRVLLALPLGRLDFRRFLESAGGRFSKAPEIFRARKAIAKSRTLRVLSCFIHIF